MHFVAARVNAVSVIATSIPGSAEAEALANAFVANGTLLTPTAVTRGAEVVIVRDPASERALRELIEEMEGRLSSVGFRAPGESGGLGELPRLLIPLRPDDRATLLWTRTAEVAESHDAAYDLFASSPLYSHETGGLSWVLTRFDSPPLPERIADAVCVAGRLAAAAGRPRAVVLVADPATVDASRLSPADARRCLADLRVPLFVWTAAEAPEPLAEGWGTVESVATWDLLDAAAGRLRRALDAQRIVWLEGSYLPREVTPADGVSGFALAGEGGR